MNIQERKLDAIKEALREEEFWLDRSYEDHMYTNLAINKANMSLLIKVMKNCCEDMEKLINKSEELL